MFQIEEQRGRRLGHRSKMSRGMPASSVGGPGFRSWICFPFQLPDDVHPGKQQTMRAQGSLPPMEETQMSCRPLASAQSSPRYWRHLGSEPVAKFSLSLCLSLVLPTLKKKNAASALPALQKVPLSRSRSGVFAHGWHSLGLDQGSPLPGWPAVGLLSQRTTPPQPQSGGKLTS